MKNKFAQFVMLSRKFNRQHLETVLVLASLVMLVLGVGAPSDGGGATGRR